MSDTPRTDAEVGEAVFTDTGCAADVVNADLASTLERELTAANHKITTLVKLYDETYPKLTAALKAKELVENDLRTAKACWDQACNDLEEAERDVARYKWLREDDRILDIAEWPTSTWDSPEALDAAIDAARKEKP